MLLRLTKGLTPGSSYYVKLFFGPGVAVVEARVVRILYRENECLAGMEFLRLSSDDRAVLRSGMA